jgi:hypothetical protein
MKNMYISSMLNLLIIKYHILNNMLHTVHNMQLNKKNKQTVLIKHKDLHMNHAATHVHC